MKAKARLAAIVLLPTPPLAEETAMILLTFGILRFWGRPRCARGIVGGAFFRGRPRGFSWLRRWEVVVKHRRIVDECSMRKKSSEDVNNNVVFDGGRVAEVRAGKLLISRKII